MGSGLSTHVEHMKDVREHEVWEARVEAAVRLQGHRGIGGGVVGVDWLTEPALLHGCLEEGGVLVGVSM